MATRQTERGAEARAAAGRLAAAWRRLESGQRRVCVAALLVVASMLLPWYSKDVSAVTPKGLVSESNSKLAITVFSFVEAAIFLVAVGVLVLMFARGERRAFHLPGGDGTIVTGAGLWCCFLVFYRFIDQPAGGSAKNISSDYGLSWGIFFGLLAALFLAYAGNRLRAAGVAEPPLPGDVAPSDAPSPARVPREPEPGPGRPRDQQVRPRDARPRPARDQAPTVVDRGDQLSFEEPDR